MDKAELLQQRVAVLAGGWSDEKEISLMSGAACQKALQKAGFSCVDLMDVADPNFIDRLNKGNYNVAFVAMHGRYGEDGCIQGLLEVLHLPYTFSGVMASAVGMEKESAKALFEAAGLLVPKGITVDESFKPDISTSQKLADELGLPLFVKPADNGSSFGISRVTNPAKLKEAVALATQEKSKALIETCIEGIEISVPVIGNQNAQALPIIQINTGAEFYDAQVKYEPSELHHIIPARLTPQVTKRAQEAAVRAHKALGCRGASRADFIVTQDGLPYLLEVNTIPGMTENSLLPDSARHAGIDFSELCTCFVALALGEDNLAQDTLNKAAAVSSAAAVDNTQA